MVGQLASPYVSQTIRAGLLGGVLVLFFMGTPTWGQGQAENSQEQPTDVLVSNMEEGSYLRSSADERGLKEQKVLDRTISVQVEGAALEEALQHIARKGDFELVYGSHPVLSEKHVTLMLQQVTVQDALKKVTQNTGLKAISAASGQVLLVDQVATGDLPASETLVVAQEQQGTITGTVTDSTTGEALPGVNVVVAETQRGTATNNDGQYTIAGVDPGVYTLQATFVGYNTAEEQVTVEDGATTTADFVLQPSTEALEGVVVIGYGTAERQNVTGSIGSIDAAEETETQPVGNITQMLQGRVPGLNAGVATTAEGNISLEIRGQNSIEAGNDPLLVVDGMPYFGSLSNLNPNDIQSIDVLKGASAAAVYGASAAAGVIEVTTKSGTSPEPTINFKASLGMARPWTNVQPYGPEGYLQYLQDAQRRLRINQPDHYFTNPDDLPSDITLEEWEAMGSGGESPTEVWLSRLGLTSDEIQNYMDGNTIDWYDEVFRDAALRQNYDISVSGNPELASYFLSLGYVDNKGSLVGNQFQAVRARLNLSSSVTDWLEVSLNSQYSNRNRKSLTPSVSDAIGASPYGDMYNEDGSLKWQPHDFPTVDNPFLTTEQAGREQEWRSNNLFGTLSAEVDLPLGFSYQARWGNDLNFLRSYLFDPSTVPFGQPAGNASRDEQTSYRWQIDNILRWEQTFADIHAFETTFLYNRERESVWNTNTSNDQFPIESLGYGGLALGSNPLVFSDDITTTGSALMGRLNYRLMDRYLLTVSYRRDGYSAFGQGNPHAYFPAVALAWHLNEEPFFNIDGVSDLKLRLSWGKNGNRDIGTYSALRRLSAGKYLYGTETVVSLSGNNLPNPNLRWERTTQYNAGVDFGLMSGRVSGSLDAYYMSSENLLLRRSLPEITGYGNVWSNLGKVVNRGVEMSLQSTNVLRESFSWNSTLAFSLNRNEIRALYGDGEDDRQNDWFIGHSLNEVYDYEILGVWQQDEAEEAAVYGKAPGDFKLRDVDGDGVLSPVEDKVFLGYTEPRYRITLGNDVQYRNFTLSTLITSHLGQYAANNNRRHSSYGQGQSNQLKYPYWTPENPTNEFARISSDADNPTFNYWEKASFVKLQNVSLTYQLPGALVERMEAQNLRVFFNAANVGALTSYYGDDPETQDQTPRLYSLGVNISF